MNKPEEYLSLRNEVLERLKILHSIINLAVILQVIAVLVFLGLGMTNYDLIIYLFSPIFSLLTYNYQANQMTMEGVAGYLMKNYQENKWDNYFGEYKRNYRLASFLKTLPLLLPQILPIIIFIEFQNNTAFFLFDFLLFLVVLINFKYKMPNLKLPI